jgi:PleD family two-component response regulator
MVSSQPRVLIAGLIPVMRPVKEALATDVETISAESFDDATRLLRDEQPDAVLVAYHFDELRPVRLIRFIRDDPQLSGVPIVLVRVLPVSLGGSDENFSSAYREVGVDEVYNYCDSVTKGGERAALDGLRKTMRAVLSQH